MRIVHLSDFHLNKENIIEFQSLLMKALLEDLVEFNKTKKIDLVLYTGDMIDKGAIPVMN
ncbi:3',5'-cyclic adenosine monophosphate phosphodiesterase CpdA [compost metagenome]